MPTLRTCLIKVAHALPAGSEKAALVNILASDKRAFGKARYQIENLFGEYSDAGWAELKAAAAEVEAVQGQLKNLKDQVKAATAKAKALQSQFDKKVKAEMAQAETYSKKELEDEGWKVQSIKVMQKGEDFHLEFKGTAPEENENGEPYDEYAIRETLEIIAGVQAKELGKADIKIDGHKVSLRMKLPVEKH